MRTMMRCGGLVVALLSAAAPAQAQGTCPNGGMQLASATIQLPARQTIAASPSDAIVLLCAAAGSSNRKDPLTAFLFSMKISADPLNARAQLEGCSLDIIERGFGDRPRVSTRARDDGALEIRMSPSDQPRCVAAGWFIPRVNDEVLVAFEHGGMPETPQRVRAADAATRQLLESGRRGSGHMSVEIERDAELAKALRAWFAHTPRQRIPAIHVEFYDALIAETGLPKMDATAAGSEKVIRVTLTDVLVTRLTPKTTRNGAILLADFNYNEMSRY